jgi:hypothetical protein
MLEKVEMVIVLVLVILIVMGSKTVQSQVKSIKVSIKDHSKS